MQEHTAEEIKVKGDRSPAVLADIRFAGVFVFSNGAIDASTLVSTVTAADGEPVFSDGAHAETKEHLGGFAVIDGPDDETARHWAGRLAVALEWPQEVHRCPGPGWRATTDGK